MNKIKFQYVSRLATIWLLAISSFAQTQAISLDRENPHHFSYKGKPTVLITSGEHYGAVMNPGFDYKIYLKTLQKDSLNLTRIMTGCYFEPVGAFRISKNTLAPDRQRLLCPWIRAADSTKFGLSHWTKLMLVECLAGGYCFASIKKIKTR